MWRLREQEDIQSRRQERVLSWKNTQPSWRAQKNLKITYKRSQGLAKLDCVTVCRFAKTSELPYQFMEKGVLAHMIFGNTDRKKKFGHYWARLDGPSIEKLTIGKQRYLLFSR